MRLIDGFTDHLYVIDKMEMNENDIRKLHRLKIEEGSCIKIISNHRGYPFLIEMEGNRIAFSKEVARKVQVIPYG